jgi:hypothetical protein
MVYNLIYVKSLKVKCSNLIGKSISSHNDVLLVKSILDENLKESISLSSLRRFFGLIPTTNPNKKTLDIISKGLGFQHFTDFCSKEQKDYEWNLLRIIIQLEQKEKLTQEDINSLIFIKNDRIILFSYFIYQIIIKKNFVLLDTIFSNPVLLPDEPFKIGEISGSMTLAMRRLTKESVSFLIPYLNSNSLLRNYLIYYSVDYNSFSGWYMQIIKNKEINKNFDESLFHDIISNTSSFLSGKINYKLSKISNHKMNKMHPILLGRYIGLEIINASNDKLIFNNVPKGKELLFFYEIMTILILTKKFNTISKIEHMYYEELLSNSGETFEDKSSINLIAFSVNNLKMNNLKLATANLELINFKHIVSSYKDYIRLLSFIPYYHIEIYNNNIKNASKILKLYVELRNELKFNFFSIKFLKTYFD